MMSDQLRLAFYGDDFTGSTDALESISKAGLKTLLFLDIPSQEILDKATDLQAIGIAGMTRAMAPSAMEKELFPAFQFFKALKPRHVHYKVCSTFDSSPETGNIGIAIKVGQQVFHNDFTPVLVAAPHLGRYSAFGNLYARMGIGSNGIIHRLDRHPSMSKHPITPASESDLRLHLKQQWDCAMGLIDLLDIEKPFDLQLAKLRQQIDEGSKVIFIDAMYTYQMARIGQLLDNQANDQTLFSVGSSGVSKALGDFWASNETPDKAIDWEQAAEQKAMLVLSGSCSPVTAGQIDHALRVGYYEIAITPEMLGNDQTSEHISTMIAEQINSGISVILHTCKGPDDSRISAFKTYFEQLKSDHEHSENSSANIFGKLLGHTARLALKKCNLERLVIAGGDTSSFVARALGIQAVEMIAPLVSGAPLCRAYSKWSEVNGLEVNLKGGQVGDIGYFEQIRKGKLN